MAQRKQCACCIISPYRTFLMQSLFSASGATPQPQSAFYHSSESTFRATQEEHTLLKGLIAISSALRLPQKGKLVWRWQQTGTQEAWIPQTSFELCSSNLTSISSFSTSPLMFPQPGFQWSLNKEAVKLDQIS